MLPLAVILSTLFFLPLNALSVMQACLVPGLQGAVQGYIHVWGSTLKDIILGRL